MPGSLPWMKREISAHVRAQIDALGLAAGEVVDVGAGAGWWSDLIGHGRMDAVEIFAPYVERFGLRAKYRQVIVNNVMALDPVAYGWRFAVMGDVLEHMTAEEARYIVRTWTAAGVRMVVALPFQSPQAATADNEHETHVQDDLTPDVIAARFHELRPLAVCDEYGYFTNYEAAPVERDGLPPLEPPQRVNVLWWEGARGYWDHGMLQAVFDGSLWPTVRPFAYVEHERAAAVGNTGAVVVVSGRWAAQNVDALREWEGRRAWTLACVTSDEESDLDPASIKTQDSLVMVQTPSPRSLLRAGSPVWGHMVLGPRIDLRRTVLASETLRACPPVMRGSMWSFAGQVRDNPARQACVSVLTAQKRAHPEDAAMLHVTNGFGQGHPLPEYLAMLRDSEVVISPSGPATPDCFRTWEALEMGALPVAQKHSPRQTYEPDYYAHALECAAGDVPFPRIESWSELPALLDVWRRDPLSLRHAQNLAFSWWQGRKRAFAYDVECAIRAVSGMVAPDHADGLRSKLTIIIPSSPCAAHPGTEMIDECIARIRAYPDLAECEILLTLDGVRPEQEHRRADYYEHVRRVLWRANWDPAWRGVLPVVFDRHAHQSGMLLRALRMVQTPLVMYVEHDTWPIGEIPFARLAASVEGGAGGLRMLRLHYDAQIHPEHEYLMLDRAPVDCGGVPVRRTRQWSQRPHIARTDYYRDTIAPVFSESDRTFVEDIVYGRAEGGPWETWGLGIYAPAGGMKRSETCDGRRGESKYTITHGGREMKA